MRSERTFLLLSYSAVLCGFFSLWVSGTFGVLGGVIFLAVFAGALFLEKTKFQMSERTGTVLTVLAIPVFYVLWKWAVFDFSGPDTALPGVLARLILTLSAIKLLQKKGDRDWIFLYVMAFFQILLAAGLSISPLYFATFVAFVVVMAATVILLEIRKTGDLIRERARRNSAPVSSDNSGRLSVRKLPVTALGLVALIVVFSVPLFFLLPRVGGAGIGGTMGGVSTYSGFSDSVRLGGIGRIQQNDAVVMRVRIEDQAKLNQSIRWRGVALDTFDNRAWSKSRSGVRDSRVKGDRDLIQVDYATGRDSLVIQTVYLEPLDTQVLFALRRPVAVQANFPNVFVDPLGSLSFPRSGERSTYKVLSDVELPSPERLRRDREPNPRWVENYLQLPEDLDPRIAQRAEELTETASNRFEAAEFIEYHLKNDFGYTLDQKAGGEQPLADFLFNVREGHCEYFATAMAVMLRTQGIATRVVNGFQQGEYNETADVYVVRQREAHSWVEVYFPGEDVWVPFDPTPAAGQNLGAGATGVFGTMTKYIEALEMFWIQYFVAFDNQEQRSLFTSIRKGVSEYNDRTSSWIADAQTLLSTWWAEVRGESGLFASIWAVGAAFGLVAVIAGLVWGVVLLYRRAVKWKFWTRLRESLMGSQSASVIDFYERMLEVLEMQGFTRKLHQTPLEFAHAVGAPEAVRLTRTYNRVRFGGGSLSAEERREVESWLESLSTDIREKQSTIRNVWK